MVFRAGRRMVLLTGLWIVPALVAAQSPATDETPDGGLPFQAPLEESLNGEDALGPADPFDDSDEPTGTAEEPAGESPVIAVEPEEPATGEDFPTSAVIEGQKAFWIRIFTDVQSNQGLLHDGAMTQPVYEKMDLAGHSLRGQRLLIRRRIQELSAELKKLAAAVAAGGELSDAQRELLAHFAEGATPKAIREAARNVRFQRGLGDRFLNGLVHSGLYLDHMREILAETGVPLDLVYLPHVESSFNYRTYSRAGAAGIWQFTRGTGREYMKIGYEVDERLDPLIATRAAGELLAANYRALKSWPLAITAYNHGRQNLLRIVARTGSRDLGYLIENYDGWLFKFASKNFYAEFLAAREVAMNHEHYFGEVAPKPSLRFHHVELPFYTDFKAAAHVLGLERDLLQELNPSLRPPVLQGMKYIPKGYTLRLPEEIPPHQFLTAIPDEMRHQGQKRTTEVVVARGDTLYDLGRRHNVPWQDIAVANNLSAYRSIRPGQRLILPSAGGAAAVAARSLPATAAPPAAPPREVVAAESPKRAPSLAQSAVPVGALAAIVPDSSSPPLPLPESVAFQRAEGASLFQDMDLHALESRRAELVAAYGETLGHYAEWAGVSTEALRRINGAASLSVIRPGDRIGVSLARVSSEDFLQKRLEYHHGREEDFYSVYAVTELSKVKVRRGDTAWSIAQSNNVPMWLFYQHNPTLINGGLQAGQTVLVPLIEEIQDIRQTEPPVRSAQAG